jgi:hypothetical protein
MSATNIRLPLSIELIGLLNEADEDGPSAKAATPLPKTEVIVPILTSTISTLLLPVSVTSREDESIKDTPQGLLRPVIILVTIPPTIRRTRLLPASAKAIRVESKEEIPFE